MNNQKEVTDVFNVIPMSLPLNSSNRYLSWQYFGRLREHRAAIPGKNAIGYEGAR
jgi:hypothetical protein